MFRTMWVFLNRETHEKQEPLAIEDTLGVYYLRGLTRSASQAPKGVLDGPLLRPCSIMRLKTSAPRRMPTRPGTPITSFHRGLKGTGNAGKGAVILGSTTASTTQS